MKQRWDGRNAIRKHFSQNFHVSGSRQGRLPTAGELAGVCAVDSAHMERVLWMCAMLIEQRTGRRLKNADEVLSFVLKGE